MDRRLVFSVLAALAVAALVAANTAGASVVSVVPQSSELDLLGADEFSFARGVDCVHQCLATGTCPLPTWPPPHGWCGSKTSPDCFCYPCNGQWGCHTYD